MKRIGIVLFFISVSLFAQTPEEINKEFMIILNNYRKSIKMPELKVHQKISDACKVQVDDNSKLRKYKDTDFAIHTTMHSLSYKNYDIKESMTYKLKKANINIDSVIITKENCLAILNVGYYNKTAKEIAQMIFDGYYTSKKGHKETMECYSFECGIYTYYDSTSNPDKHKDIYNTLIIFKK